MPTYREEAVTGTKYRRCNAAYISNELDQMPSIRFVEEDVVVVNTNEVVKTPAQDGGIVNYLTDPSETFDLISPVDGSILGTMTYGEAFTAMYSLYFHAATERDAAASGG